MKTYLLPVPNQFNESKMWSLKNTHFKVVLGGGVVETPIGF